MDVETLKVVLWGILVGVLSGGGAALIGYLKGKTLETVEWDKAAGTIVIGLVVGGLAAYLGVPYDEAYQIIITLGLVTVLNQVGMGIYRRIVDWWNSRKPKPTPATELPVST